MDTYINQDILSFLNIDSRVIVKRITQLWNSHILMIGIKESELKDAKDLLRISCYDGSIRKINDGTYDWDLGLYYACKGGHIDIIEMMIDKGAKKLNSELLKACVGGHLEIVKLMIKKGANDWKWGLLNACYGGNIDIVRLIISNGANDWNNGLKCACQGGHMDIIELIIDKGATYCSHCNKSIEEHLKNEN